MVRTALATLVLVMLAVPALAYVGSLGMFADDQGNVCQLNDTGGLIETFVVHRYIWDGATGCRFKIEPPTNGTWLFLNFESTYTPIGSALTDLSVGYGGCVQPQVIVGKALWFSTVPVTGCGFVRIQPADGPGQIIITDCLFAEQSIANAQPLYVNPSPACNCTGATQPTTWGSVKALYR